MMLTRIRRAVLMFLAAGPLAAGATVVGSAWADPDQPPPGKNPPPPSGAGGAAAPAGVGEGTTRQPRSAEPVERADLYAHAKGAVKATAAAIGDRVRKGQMLAEIEALELVLDEQQARVGVAQAEALLAEAQAKLDGAKAEVATAGAGVRLAEVRVKAAKATLDHRTKQPDRMKELAATKAVDQKLADEAEDHFLAAQATASANAAAVDAAEAAVPLAVAKVQQAQAAVTTATANATGAKLGLEKARLAASRARVVAPFDGVVTRRAACAGDVVRPGGAGPLFTVVRADVLRVVVQVPDRDVPLVKPGVPADVESDPVPGVKLFGKVSRVGFAEDLKTRTMRAEIDVPNPDGKLRPGMYGAAILMLGKAPRH